MQKKSKKKTNKTHNGNHSDKKENGGDLSYSNIVKEIDGLKKELVSIRSQKYLHTFTKQKERKEPLENIDSGNKIYIQETKSKMRPIREMEVAVQEDHKCRCYDFKEGQTRYQKSGNQWLKVELAPINIKCRQTKLKIQIQQNKIKSCMQRFQVEDHCKKQLLQLMQSELNSTNMILNKVISDMEQKISENKSQYKQMKEQLQDLSIKVMKMGEKYVNQKNLNEGQMQQIADLKRQLSYYMSLMKDSENEAHKYSKQYTDLELYVKELQNSNQLLRKEISYLENNLKESSRKIQILSQERDGLQKSLKLRQSDLHLSQVQKTKYKQKRKQIQKQVEKLSKQIHDHNQKLVKKDQHLTKLQQKIKQMQSTIAQFQSQEKQNIKEKTSKKLEIDKLTKQNTILSLTLTEKEDILKNQDEILVNLKQKYQVQSRNNKKLLESVQIYQMEINELSSEIDELRKANQRYKNQHFKNKLVGYNGESKGTLQGSTDQIQQQKWKINSHSKNRKKILGQIQDLIQKHRRSQSSDDEASNI